MSCWLTLSIQLPTEPRVKVFVTDEEEGEYVRTGSLPDSVAPRIRAQLTPEEQELWDLTAGSKKRQ